LKQATLILALLGAIVLAGCGNGDTTNQSTFNNGSGDQPFKPTTHLSHRSLVTNYYAGDLQVMDATQDRLTTFTFGTGSQPTYMQSSPDGTLTLVNNTGANSISSFNNNLEAVKATISLGGLTQSFVTSVSNKVGFAAVPNYSNGNPPNLPGAIARFNPTDGSLNTAIPLANVTYIAMDPAEKHLLAFSGTDDIARWVDLTTLDVNGLPVVSTLNFPTGTFSHAVAAFFSTDSTKAYILSCGVECGGVGLTLTLPANTTCAPTSSISTSCTYPAWVTEVDVTNPAAPAIVNQWGVLGARRGLIDLTANKLYVTGSNTTLIDSGGNNVQDGYFSAINLTASTPPTPILIGNGAKTLIRNINGVFWVGSMNCGVQSCITLVNLSTSTATTLSAANGNATGISLSVNSGEVYTIEGGEFFIYDQQGNPISSQYNTDIKGQAYDVLYID
jgi:uncharacterized lipoprotein NlpE involved in copper resistance